MTRFHQLEAPLPNFDQGSAPKGSKRAAPLSSRSSKRILQLKKQVAAVEVAFGLMTSIVSSTDQLMFGELLLVKIDLFFGGVSGGFLE